MKIRNHVVAIAKVTFMSRVMAPANMGGEMECVGKEPMTTQVIAIIPGDIMTVGNESKHVDLDSSLRYLEAFLNERFGHWGLIDSKRYRLEDVVFHQIDGLIEKAS